ncbi:CAP domain-containing protein [Deinococcus malanensis]|nr:CAP domain-containing protein [Deinococcus malanensis]
MMWSRALRAVGWTAGLLLIGVLAMGWAGWLPHIPLFASWGAAGSAPPHNQHGPAADPAPQPADIVSPDPSGVAPGPEATSPISPAPSTLPDQPSVPEPTPDLPSAPRAATSPLPPQQHPSAALASLNAVRALAQLPAVGWQDDWAAQCAAHARYLVRADRAEHRQDRSSPHHSEAGEACAHGHYFVSSQPPSGPERAMGYWATGPFHLPQLLDPRLKVVAFGEAHDPAGAMRSAGVLDVRRGLLGQAAYPVRFPAPGTVTPYREAARYEWPDPLPGCRYRAPAGAPVALLAGSDVTVSAAALKVNGQAVDACLLTAQTFQGTSPGDTQAGRGVLAAQGGAVLLPREPLPAGAHVQVSLRTSQGRQNWSFQVGGAEAD